MKYSERKIITNARLIGGLIAFASAGVMAVAGGNADHWGRALMYVSAACGLAVIAVFLLIKIRRNNNRNESVSGKYRELLEATGVSDEMFNRFYLPVAEQLEAPALRYGIATLRLRRGVYLGTQQGHENARRNRDRWTYAVFLAAVHKASERGMELVLFRTPQDARDWLLREELVVSTLADALTGTGATKNPIKQLLTDTAKNAISPATKRSNTIETNVKTATHTNTTNPVREVKRRSLPMKMDTLTDTKPKKTDVDSRPPI